MPAFWDASALVPLCVPGQAEPRGRRLLAEYQPVVWWGTPVEMADALQLAAALVWCNRRPARRHFICLDRKLRMAARAEGFTEVEW